MKSSKAADQKAAELKLFNVKDVFFNSHCFPLLLALSLAPISLSPTGFRFFFDTLLFYLPASLL